jgi:hypothetical protein
MSEKFNINSQYVSTVMSDNDTNAVATYLAEHPRAMGILFTALLLLSQAGSVAAANHTAISGP